jgi:hypothetical protein
MPAVKEPVLVAVIGVGGVVVGGLASGTVQSYLARSDRRRSGRNAARLLYMQLHNAEKALSDVRELRDWGKMITDWSAYGSAWDRHNEPLAHRLNTARFTAVSSAFACLASLSSSHDRNQRQAGPTAAPDFDPPDELLGLYLVTVQRAKRVVLKASFRWWEMRSRRKALAEKGPPKLPAPEG